MSGKQIQAGRVLLGWTQSQLAEAAKVSVPTVKRAEGSGRLSASSSAEAALRRALRDNGIQFLDTGGVAKGPGVALKDEG